MAKPKSSPYDNLFTSYFAEPAHKLDERCKAVSIAVGTPSWFRGPRRQDLYPRRSWLSLPRDAYIEAYNSMLADLNVEQVAYDLYEQTNGKTPVLVCWEPRGFFCHRRLVAEWFEDRLPGVHVPEYGQPRARTLAASAMPLKEATAVAGQTFGMALTVHQPYAWAICSGLKTIENRSWSTPYRGRLYIHAGLSVKSLAAGRLRYDVPPRLSYGAIIGSVELVDCVPYHHSLLQDDPTASGPNCLILANAKRFQYAHPFTGRLGLFKVSQDFS